MYENAITSIKKHEGFSPRVYKDSKGIDTIGYGFAIKDLVLDETVSEIILRQIVDRKIHELRKRLDWFYEMPLEIQNVIIEMSYQLGIDGFLKFKKTIEYLKRWEFEKAADEMLASRWAKSDSPIRAERLSKIVRAFNAVHP